MTARMMAKAGYHHGTLRQALVDAATERLAQDGARGFTLAQAAKAAGVTPAAVYRHFRGRDDLIAEVARQGYERLALLTDTALRHKGAEPAVLAYGAAFMTFAEACPGHFAAIYTSGLDPTSTPALRAAKAQSDAILLRLCARLQPAQSPEKSPEESPEEIARPIQALCLGLTQISGRPDAAALRAALTVYLAGLRSPQAASVAAER